MNPWLQHQQHQHHYHFLCLTSKPVITDHQTTLILPHTDGPTVGDQSGVAVRCHLPPSSSLSPSSLCSSNPLHDVTENSSFHSGHSTPSAVVLHCSAAWKVKEVKQEELQESFCFRLQGRLPAVKQSGGKYDLWIEPLQRVQWLKAEGEEGEEEAVGMSALCDGWREVDLESRRPISKTLVPF